MLTKIEISGIDVTSYLINYMFENVWGESISEIELNFINHINDSVGINEGLVLEVWRGWVTSTDEKIFDGYVESFNSEGGKIRIVGKDKLWDAVRKEVTHVYDASIDPSAGVISEIFEDLIETYAGLNCTVVSSGSTFILDKFVCNHADIFERCKNLAKTLEWQFFYLADTNIVYFEPQGNDTNSLILEVGTNIMQVPKWEYDITNMTNDLTVVGAFQEIETTESGQIGVTSGYTTSSILLGFEPISVKVYADASNPPTTLRTGGLPDSTASYFYYIDKANKKVLPATGTSFTTNHYFENRFSHAVPIPVHLLNQESIDTYSQFKKTITYKDVRSVADAEVRALNYLGKYSQPYVYSTIKVKTADSNNFEVGQLIRVVDNVNTPAVDDFFVITKHRIRYPADYEELVVGDKTFRLAEWQSSVEERLKRLSEDEIANQDLITELVSADTTSLPIVFNPRYSKVMTQTPSGTNVFILGHATFGILGTQKLGDAGIGAEVDVRVIPYQSTYDDTFVDEDFKNDSTTAYWDTTNGRLVMSSSGDTAIVYNTMGRSEIVYADNQTVLSATLSCSETKYGNDVIYYYLSPNNGSNWEQVTKGASHTFTNVGTQLVWMIVFLGNGGSNTYIEDLSIEVTV